MSFLRPAALATLRRWGEPVVALLVTGVLATSGFDSATTGAPIGWVLLAGAAVSAFWLRAATLRALARRPAQGPGIVVLREGEIGFLGPWAGGFLDLDAIERVEIYRLSELDEPLWRIVAVDGTVLMIPADAEGADHIPEALTALPGFSDLTAVKTLARIESGRRVIWRRRARQVTRALGPDRGE